MCVSPQLDTAESGPAGRRSDSSTGPSRPEWVDVAHTNRRKNQTPSLRFAAGEQKKKSKQLQSNSRGIGIQSIPVITGILDWLGLHLMNQFTWQTTLAGRFSRLSVFLSYQGSNIPSRWAMSFVLSPELVGLRP